MNLHPLDYLIILASLSVVLAMAWYTRRYTRSVADFLSANRCAGRYLLTVASSAAGFGTITIVAQWEQFYQAGFGALHWAQMLTPIALILAMSGWVIYRYRQTRVMTLAQFLERRYSRRFRIFAGVLCWLSGILNYGIFPAVTARFFIYFLGLPVWEVAVPGTGLTLNLTLGIVMALILGVALFITLNGGQIAVMVSDWVQGQFLGFAFVVLLGVLLWLFPWEVIIGTLKQAPDGQSKLNPFEQSKLPDFNPLFFLLLAALRVYNYMVWQGSQGYNSAAKNPHEAKMAVVIAQFRTLVQALIVPLAAIAAYVLMHAPEYATQATSVRSTLDTFANPQMATQMTTTVAMAEALPVGVLGLLAAVMIMATITTDSTYLHSWGSIFVQDVAMPVRQLRGWAKWTPKQHLWALRGSVVFVAVFAWVFSMLFPLQEYIFMYFQITGAIFTGGAGAVLIGGLYWKRGTTAGAWAAMLTGCSLAVVGIVTINLVWPNLVPYLQAAYPSNGFFGGLPEKFWLNGVQMAFVASLSAASAYVLASLLSPDPWLDTDKLFHRGPHAAELKDGEPADRVAAETSVPGWQRKLGVTDDFTRGDKWIFAAKYALFVLFFGGFIVLTVANRGFGVMTTDDAWANWWLFNVVLSGVIGTAATVWFLIGGLKDLRELFRVLRQLDRDTQDDGTVTEHLGGPADVVGSSRSSLPGSNRA
ncbi:MAG: sodium:solute symporter [Planctomycetota bacterium]